MTLNEIDWTKLGQALRESALDAHNGELPNVEVAYGFLVDNPECFKGDDADWPVDMPVEPNIELIAAYLGSL